MKPADNLQEELLRLISRQAKRVPLVVLLVAVVIVSMASERVPMVVWSSWLALVIVVLIVRLLVLRRLPDLTDIPVERRILIVIALSALNGIVHGSSLMFFPYLDGLERAVQSILIIGMCTGAVATTAGYVPIFAAYLVPTMVPLTLLWLLSPRVSDSGTIELSLAILIVLFSLILVSLAADSFRLFRESFEIRLEQAATNEKLQIALRQAEAANFAKTRFLASASHDLRQPIHTLSLFGAALSNRPLDDKSLEIVEHINVALVSLSSQLDALLDISKLDAGIVEANQEPADLGAILDGLQEEFEPAAAEKGIGLSVDDCHHVIIETDPGLLTRVLRNLLSNAVKYTDEGAVGVFVDADERACAIRIRDSGPGIPEDEQARVFEEFYQLNNPGRDRSKGLGLGLAIVRRLAALLGVGLDMHSTPGSGTEFTVTVPRIAGETFEQEDSPLPEPSPADLRVLVVDDEIEVRLGMQALLEGRGCQVGLAEGTLSAAETARRWEPDIVLSDFRLRGEDNGIATVAAIREIYPGLPAILISGDTAPDRLRQAEEAGLTLLHKPVLADVLWQAIARVSEENDNGRNDLRKAGRRDA